MGEEEMMASALLSLLYKPPAKPLWTRQLPRAWKKGDEYSGRWASHVFLAFESRKG